MPRLDHVRGDGDIGRLGPVEDLAGTTDNEDLIALFEGIRIDLHAAQQPVHVEEEHTRVELSIEDAP